MGPSRDDYPLFPGVKGFWIQVLDKNGNSHNLSSLAYDKKNHDLAWYPLKRQTIDQLKQQILSDDLSLNPSDYEAYAYEGADTTLDGEDVIDDLNVGLKKKKPLIFAENRNDSGDDGEDGESNSGNGDDSENAEDDSEEEESSSESEDDDQSSYRYENTGSSDPYRNFTRRLQCITNGDWSVYPESIRSTYNGEILWTDGNQAYAVGTMPAYMVVRRSPSVPTGPVVEVGQLKELFLQKRQEFWKDPASAGDLEAYARRDDTHEYTVLKGFIPPTLVGKETPRGQSHWRKSDTFFTDFAKNYPDQVLSESEDSLIIGNTASHDTRQYLAKWDRDGKDRTASAGMSYMHLLVIPKREILFFFKKKVYNVVSLGSPAIIEEMIAHFWRFWESPESRSKITWWLKEAVERRAASVVDTLTSQTPTLVDEFQSIMKEVLASTEKFARTLRELRASEDDKSLVFGFHPAPEASIGHLHMHIVLAAAEFREFSTRAHDWKTIPAKTVVELISGEARRCDADSVDSSCAFVF
ncbi:hypothetical protein NLJ89_g6120 [Agrocybe chaxingu]|uniref:Uncharacterized protein n=1 Tax=Agrocybe chaxingu TaxID=84603 RepID=A0A9W8K1B4_9AGAR|nr:hypothetical protein NLJ89_g6120 [Agrocybe chaxingu]